MAISTLTATAATATAIARYNATGVVERTVKYTYVGGTLSDIILLMKIPDRAVVMQAYGTVSSAEAAVVFKLGITGSEAALGTHTASASATTAFDSIVDAIEPVQLSLTDAAEPHVGYLYATTSVGSWSTTVSLAVTIRYTNDGL